QPRADPIPTDMAGEPLGEPGVPPGQSDPFSTLAEAFKGQEGVGRDLRAGPAERAGAPIVDDRPGARAPAFPGGILLHGDPVEAPDLRIATRLFDRHREGRAAVMPPSRAPLPELQVELAQIPPVLGGDRHPGQGAPRAAFGVV